jgi:DNA-directed RNA polymerase alpha subunit
VTSVASPEGRAVLASDQTSGEVEAAMSDLTPIAQVKFSERRIVQSRICNALTKAGIATLGDIANCTEADLLRIQSFGYLALSCVKDTLAESGLSLKQGDNPQQLARRTRRNKEYWQALIAAERAERDKRRRRSSSQN